MQENVGEIGGDLLKRFTVFGLRGLQLEQPTLCVSSAVPNLSALPFCTADSGLCIFPSLQVPIIPLPYKTYPLSNCTDC